VTIPERLSNDDERRRMLSTEVSDAALKGWIVVQRDDHEFLAILSFPAQHVNNTAHAIITVLTCLLWVPVWLIIYAGRRKERRLRVSVGPDLRVVREQLTIH